MRKYIIFSALTLIITAGCVSMPDSVNESYLVNKTKEEQAQLENIEDKIIAARPLIGQTKTELDNAEKSLTISSGQLRILNKQKALLECLQAYQRKGRQKSGFLSALPSPWGIRWKNRCPGSCKTISGF